MGGSGNKLRLTLLVLLNGAKHFPGEAPGKCAQKRHGNQRRNTYHHSPLAKEKGLALSLTLPERDVPVMQLDKDRITQVLSILLDNALAYTPAPGDIRLELGLGRDSARITVSDTGPGVPDSEKTRIFERFHRGEEARSHRSHFGLGLCIAAEIVKLHKGKLWVEDAKGGGAAFILELPIS